MVTFAEYTRYAAPPGTRDELINGEILLSPSPNRRHQDLCLALQRLLETHVSSNYVVRLDTTINLGIAEGPRPDVFVIDRARWIEADEHGGYPQGSPQLVVEVKSNSNSWPELHTKKDLFLDDPRCQAVWIVDPDASAVRLYRPGQPEEIKARGDMLNIPALIGDGFLNISQIFDSIVK